MRDAIRHSADTRLLSLAAGEPAIDRFPTEAFQRAIDAAINAVALAVRNSLQRRRLKPLHHRRSRQVATTEE